MPSAYDQASDLFPSTDPARISRRSFHAAVAGAFAYSWLAHAAQLLPLQDDATRVEPRSIAYLMADRAVRSSTLQVRTDETRAFVKRFWVQNWRNPGQSFTWGVDVERAGEYEVTLMLSAPPGSELEVRGPKNALHLTCEAAHPESAPWNWNRTSLPATLSLPSGKSTISVRLVHALSGATGAALRSIELLNVAERPALEARIHAFRSDTQWMSTAKFGIMCQCGEWSYPPHGPKKSWPQMVDTFDVNKYVEMVASTGAAYAVWSATWATYYFPAPISAIDRILLGRTSKRDLIGEIADGLAKRNMRLLLYYHAGHSDKDWWARNWVSPDDKTLFVRNWCAIISEVGERYKERLAGWMFDDEMVYYPAPYEKLGEAAKAGNSSRIISYNAWIGPRGTDFQDFQFGEGFMGSPDLMEADQGLWPSGPMKSLHAHGNFQIDGPDWGINKPDTVIQSPLLTTDKAIRIALEAAARHQALSWNLLMYEDGSVSPASLSLLQQVGLALRRQYPKA